MQVNWNYQSQSNDMQSLSWAYKLDEDFYGTGTSATQVDGNDSVDGSTWLSGLTADGGSHTLYVALLDGSGNPLAGDQHSFTYNAGSDPYSSDEFGYQSPEDGYQSDATGFNTINITYPTIYNVSDWNSLEIEWTYASGVADQSSPDLDTRLMKISVLRVFSSMSLILSMYMVLNGLMVCPMENIPCMLPYWTHRMARF